MVTTAVEQPSQAEGSGLFTVAWYNIRSGCNGGLESALIAMRLMGVDCGVFLETKLTKSVYTHWRVCIHTGAAVTTSDPPMRRASDKEGASETYEIEEVEMLGPNVLSFQLVLGATQWYIVGCYIPPNDLTTLTHVEQAWQACPWGCLPILLGDLNVNLAAPRDNRDKTIAEQVDTMALSDMSAHFRQWSGKQSSG